MCIVPHFDYKHLLKDPNLRRWYENVARGTTAAVWIRRVGMVDRRYGRSPQQLAAMTPKRARKIRKSMKCVPKLDGRFVAYRV